jgi:hypothetical protein
MTEILFVERFTPPGPYGLGHSRLTQAEFLAREAAPILTEVVKISTLLRGVELQEGEGHSGAQGKTCKAAMVQLQPIRDAARVEEVGA